MNYPLHKRIGEIRDLIDEPRKEHSLNQDSTLFLMLRSCIEVIEITETALESYLKKDTDSSDIGIEFLNMFGALQALYVQQEAIRNLHEAIKIPYTEHPSIEMIRHIRTDAAGHPTNRGNKKAFNFFSVWNYEGQGLELITGYPTTSEIRPPKRSRIDIAHLIDTQKSVFTEVLNNVIETLREEQVVHRKKFAGETMTSVFQITDHSFSTIYDIAHSPDSPRDPLVLGCVDDILKAIDKFKTGLKEREESDDTISYRYENLDYALQHIKKCFGNGKETHIDRKDAYIFAHFAEHEVQKLKEIAQEIDERYSQ